MSQRRISWIEQNVEKVVMGAVGAVFLGVVGLQVLYQPNKIKVGSGPDVPPEQYLDAARQSAKNLQGQINTTSPAEAPKVDLDLPKALDKGLTNPVVPQTRMALGPAAQIHESAGEGPVGSETIAELKVGAPTDIAGASLAATIHPLERVWHSDLAALLPAQQPFDKVGVSVEGTFNGVALLEALAADPDGDGPIQPMPRGLWQDPMTQEVLVDIIQVELERELVRPAPGSTEAAGTKATIAGMPGRFDVKALWDSSVHARGDVHNVVQQLRGMDEMIERPPYYALIAGMAWEEPRELASRFAAGNASTMIPKLKADLSAAREALKAAEAALAALPAPGTAPTPAREGDRPPPSGPRGGSRMGGSGGSVPPPTGKRSPTPKAEDPTTIRLNAQAKVNRLKSKVAGIEHRLGKLGVNASQPETTDTTPVAAPVQSLYENDEAKLWAHDMTAQPGAAYRYRMRVVVNNPLFGTNLIPAQKSLAENSLVYGAYSEWSEPVEVDSLNEFFIISASEANPPATVQPTASAQLYKFFYGAYRLANVGVTPGDIFAAEIKVPELPIYDLTKLAELYPEGKGFPGTPPGPGANPSPDRDPGRRPGRLAEPGPASPPPPGGVQPPKAENDGVARIENVPFVVGEKSLSAGVASVFLDAQRLIVPGMDLSNQQRDVVAAILRDANGRVVARSPEIDRGSTSFQRIQAYLKAMEVAKAPPTPPPTGNQAPGQVEPPSHRQAPPSGGGGGAGGG